MYYSKDFTNGLELEMADVDTRIKLPPGNVWDIKDYTIANSNGIGNDPKHEFTVFGGEINVKPANTVRQQIKNVHQIFTILGKNKTTNHTTNLHVHVGVPGLSGDLEALKKLATYIYRNQTEAFRIVERLEIPLPFDYASIDEFKGAVRRYHRRKISHQKKLGKGIYRKMKSAKTIKEFYEAHAPMDKNGKPCFALTTRCGINLMQLFNETDTVEFRHFPMTFDLTEIQSALVWCLKFMNAALNTGAAPKELEEHWMQFPEFDKYNHQIEERMRLTSVHRLTRKEVRRNINKLLEYGVITKMELYGN